MELFIILFYLIFGILSLILFFKIWGMTNDVDKILTILQKEVRKKEETKTSEEQKTSEITEEPQKTYEFDPTIKVGDIVRLKSNNVRYKVNDIVDDICYCRDMVFDKFYKYKIEQFVKYKEDQI